MFVGACQNESRNQLAPPQILSGKVPIPDFGLAALPLISDMMSTSISSQLFRALLDTGTHSLVGFLTWLAIEPKESSSSDHLTRLLGVTIMSGLIDIDHFLVARSLDIKHVVAAGHRGLFHCSGLTLVVNGFLWCHNGQMALCFLASWLPHHIRDASRRGFYIIPPQIHTAPLRYDIASFLIVLFPWIVSSLKVKLAPLHQPVRTVFNV